MPAKLEEAFGSSYDNIVKHRQIPEQRGGGFGTNPSNFGTNPSTSNPNANCDAESLLTSLDSLKNPDFDLDYSVNRPVVAQSSPNRPEFSNPYVTDRNDLERRAYRCAPNGIPITERNPAPYNSDSCDSFLQHIWSCTGCRNRMRELIAGNVEQKGAGSRMDLSGIYDSGDYERVDSSKPNGPEISLQNIIYSLLIGLGLIILFDYLLRVARQLKLRL